MHVNLDLSMPNVLVNHLPARRRLKRIIPLGTLFSALMLAVSASAGYLAAQGPALEPPSSGSLEPLPDAPLPQSTNTLQSNPRDDVTLRNTPLHILKDQAAIWTSPARIRGHDLKWLLPLTLATGVAISTDHRAMSQVVSHDANFNQANINASNALVYSFVASPVALYGFGHFRENQHAREAGILSGEALIDGVVVEQGMKLIFWRERPAVDSARGRFFQSSAGIDSSFPSSHTVLAWAAASVIATEYPSRWTQIFVYSAAAGVSLTRVLGQEHFPSDVLVGSAAGWLIGRYVVHRHRRHAVVAH